VPDAFCFGLSICYARLQVFDGMCLKAFWYTEKRLEEGPVFGSADRWNGLGIFFDSFDNDGLHNNPYISVMLNDGTKSYDHDTYVHFLSATRI